MSTIIIAPAENVFATIYGHLLPEVVLNSAPGWRLDPAFIEEVAAVTAEVVRTGRCAVPANGADAVSQREMLATASGIDRAFAEIHPRTGSRLSPAGLRDARARHSRFGRYNDQADAYLVLPRLAHPERDEQAPDRLDLLFGSLLLVDQAFANRARHVPIPLSSRVDHESRARGLVVSCVPFLDDPDEVEWGYPVKDGLAYYSIEVRDTPALSERATSVGRALAVAETDLVVMPEATNSDTLQDHWTTTAAQAVADGAPLRWVFAGTGDLHGPDHPGANTRVNEGWLFDAATGDVLIRARKGHRFDVTAELVSKGYPLVGAPPEPLLREDIHVGSQPVIAEMGSIRLAILICEDLARLEDLLSVTFAFGVSHVLAPVFSKPTAPHRWEQAKGSAHAEGCGTTVVVANSLLLGRLVKATGRLPASLVVNPHGCEAAGATDASDLATYRLRDTAKPELL